MKPHGADLRTAWRFYLNLRTWRRRRVVGHFWVRVDVQPERLTRWAVRRFVDEQAGPPVYRVVVGPLRDDR